MQGEIASGTRWREVETGRVIVVLGRGPDSPWWRYEDEQEPRYCCLDDFTIWRRFVPIQEPPA